ncbi:unnamed protein product [Didymodactylos carnosus]|nr:unnamed protein product [Didymodactylos carnosus]CAF3532325.1 unnamed protein product [Didymodactylos carnosus]
MTSFPDSNIDELSPTSPLSLHPLPYPSLPTDSYQNILTISPLSTVTEPVPVSSSISKHSTTTVTTRKENLRLQYNYRQRYMLNEIFAFIPYPNCIQKSIIADRIGCTREQIRIWFQNKRRLAAQRSSNQNNNQNKRLTRNEINAIQHGISSIDKQELEQILIELNNHKNAPQRLSASKRR